MGCGVHCGAGARAKKLGIKEDSIGDAGSSVVTGTFKLSLLAMDEIFCREKV